MTKDLGRDVRELQRRTEATSVARHQALCASLASDGELYTELQIPDTAGPLQIVADLSERQIRLSTELDAPKEGQSRGRISWMLRQLQKAPPELTIEAKVAYTSSTLTATLAEVREDPTRLVSQDKKREIRGFRLTLIRDLGLNRSGGRGSFIDSVVANVKTFYGDVLQKLTAWKPRAPQLRTAGPVESSVVPQPPAIEEAIEIAEPAEGYAGQQEG
jgi:hypothetical protein